MWSTTAALAPFCCARLLLASVSHLVALCCHSPASLGALLALQESRAKHHGLAQTVYLNYTLPASGNDLLGTTQLYEPEQGKVSHSQGHKITSANSVSLRGFHQEIKGVFLDQRSPIGAVCKNCFCAVLLLVKCKVLPYYSWGNLSLTVKNSK